MLALPTMRAAILSGRSSLLTGLVAYWSLEEASGPRADRVGSSVLTDNNTVTQNPGKVDNAAQFTAANVEHLSRVSSAVLQTGDIDFTFSAWVYLDAVGAHRWVITKSNAASSGEYGLYYVTTSARFAFYIQNGATFVSAVATDTGAPSLATWYHLLAWHDSVANTVNLQVNGGTINSTSTGATVPATTADPFEIGTAGVVSYMAGRIDEVGFWKRLLTNTERVRLYNGGAGVSWPNF